MYVPLSRPPAIAMAVMALVSLLGAPPVLADAGHDHGAAAPKAASPGLPRFAATSELFELVGVVNGRQLTLYLDRSAENSPVKGAKLDLEIGAVKVDVKPRAEGEFEATLAQPLPGGVIAVTATVLAGQESDLLAGEFTVQPAANAEAPPARRWREIAGWAAAGLAALAVLAWLARRALGGRTAGIGGAA